MSVVQYMNRAVELPTTPAQMRLCSEGPHDDWEMLDAERAMLAALLNHVRPKVAIEIGVYKAGSLGVLASNATHVYALDIDPSCERRYAAQFPNVTFVTGNSRETLPALIDELQASGTVLEFVLIDADHTESGVRSDITNVLRYRPTTCPLYVVMHDSFNPGCRAGMRNAPWEANPHVHAVELDFVMGNLAGPSTPPEYHRTMWCGLGLGVLLPEHRTQSLTIGERERWTFEAALRQSVYTTHVSDVPLMIRKRLGAAVRGGRKRLGAAVRRVPIAAVAVDKLRHRRRSQA